ncbi:hypothetical protein WA538_004510 [Blastocystis sp. DL]
MNSTGKSSRSELLKWINETLCVQLNSIDKLHNGAIYCQIMHILYPDTIQLSRVNFLAGDSFECQRNYRILQSAFTKKSIQFNLDIDKLSKGRPQDNLELIQFMRELYDKVYDGHPYDPVASRERSKGGKEITDLSHSLEQFAMQRSATPRTMTSRTLPTRGLSVQPSLQRASLTGTPSAQRQRPPVPIVPRRIPTLRAQESLKEVETLREKVKSQEQAIQEKDNMIEVLGKEGTSMYDTLRKVEDFLLVVMKLVFQW